jgi:hypothetical protein
VSSELLAPLIPIVWLLHTGIPRTSRLRLSFQGVLTLPRSRLQAGQPEGLPTLLIHVALRQPLLLHALFRSNPVLLQYEGPLLLQRQMHL